jgi:hypothetical protein
MSPGFRDSSDSPPLAKLCMATMAEVKRERRAEATGSDFMAAAVTQASLALEGGAEPSRANTPAIARPLRNTAASTAANRNKRVYDDDPGTARAAARKILAP